MEKKYLNFLLKKKKYKNNKAEIGKVIGRL